MSKYFTGHRKKSAIISIVVFVVLMVTPVVLIAAYHWTSVTFTDQVVTQQQTLADVAALAVKVRLDRLASISSSLASSSQIVSDVANGQWTAAADVARDLENNVNYYDPFIDRIIVYDANGTQRGAYPELTGGLGTNASTSAWYGALARGTQSSYVSGVTTRISSPQIQVVNIAAPVLSDKKIVGFLVLQIPTDNFLDFGGNISVGTYGFAYIVDSEGNIVAHPKFLSDNAGVINYSSVPEVKKVLAGQSGTDIVTDSSSGEKGIVTYKPIEKYGWGIVAQELYSEAFSTASVILFDLSLFIIFLTALNIIIAYILYQYLITHHNE